MPLAAIKVHAHPSQSELSALSAPNLQEKRLAPWVVTKYLPSVVQFLAHKASRVTPGARATDSKRLGITLDDCRELKRALSLGRNGINETLHELTARGYLTNIGGALVATSDAVRFCRQRQLISKQSADLLKGTLDKVTDQYAFRRVVRAPILRPQSEISQSSFGLSGSRLATLLQRETHSIFNELSSAINQYRSEALKHPLALKTFINAARGEQNLGEDPAETRFVLKSIEPRLEKSYSELCASAQLMVGKSSSRYTGRWNGAVNQMADVLASVKLRPVTVEAVGSEVESSGARLGLTGSPSNYRAPRDDFDLFALLHENISDSSVRELIRLGERIRPLRGELYRRYEWLKDSTLAFARVDPTNSRYPEICSMIHSVLVACFDKFDPSLGIQFESFAAARLRFGVLDLMRKWGSQEGVTRKEYHAGAKELSDSSSLNFGSIDGAVDSEGSDTTLSEYIADSSATQPDHELMRNQRWEWLLRLVNQTFNELKFSPRDREVINAYFIREELDGAQIALKLGITRSRINQINTRFADHLRQLIVSSGLAEEFPIRVAGGL